MRTRPVVAAVAALLIAAPAQAGTFGQPELVDSPASASCPGPDVGADGQGGATIVYQGAGGLRAATRPLGGSWTTQALGTGQRGKLDVSADGDSLYAWRQNNLVRTAYRAAGGGWEIPDEGQPGAFAATSALAVAAGLDSEGEAVVAWLDEVAADSFAVRYARRDVTGTWSAPADAAIPGGVRGFGNAHAFLDDRGAIVLAFQDATAPPDSRAVMRLARRDPSGAWSASDLTPGTANLYVGGGCNNAFDAELDPVTGRIVVGYGVNSAGSGAAPDRYQVWEGTSTDLSGALKVDVPSRNTPPYQAVSVRPGGLSGGAVAAFKLAEDGDNQDVHGFAAPGWTTHSALTSVNSVVTSMGVARTTGLDLAAIWTFIDADAPQAEVYKVRGMARDHNGVWGEPVTITTGSNYGGVNMAPDGAGGAIGTWVDTSGKLWAVNYFGGPPVPDGGPPQDGEEPAPPGQTPPGAFAPEHTIVGTPGPDTLTGTPQDDLIVGLGGDDRIDGGGGNDTIIGGSGKDVITGGAGRDKLLGGDGDDHLLTADGGEVDEAQAGTGVDRVEIEVPVGEPPARSRQLGVNRLLKKLTVTLDWGAFRELSGTVPDMKPLCDLAARVCGSAGTVLNADLGGLGSTLQSSLRDMIGRQAEAELPSLLTPAMSSGMFTLSRLDGGALGRISQRLGIGMTAGERAELRRVLDRATGAMGGIRDVLGDFADRMPEIGGLLRSMTGGSPEPGVVRFDDDGRLSGSARDDLLVGSGRGDRVEGGGGDDLILPVGGNDRVDGGAGNDLVLGSGGGDRLAGGRGDDHVSAGGGDDRIDLGSGNDSAAVAGAGRDRFNFGSGFDSVGVGRPSRGGLLGSVSRVLGASGRIAGMIGPGLGNLCRDVVAGVCEGTQRVGSGLGSLGDLVTQTAAEVLRVPPERGSGGILGGVTRMLGGVAARLPGLGSVLRPGLIPIVPTASLTAAQAGTFGSAVAGIEQNMPEVYEELEDALGRDSEVGG